MLLWCSGQDQDIGFVLFFFKETTVRVLPEFIRRRELTLFISKTGHKNHTTTQFCYRETGKTPQKDKAKRLWQNNYEPKGD
jgi:hypothetical protein